MSNKQAKGKKQPSVRTTAPALTARYVVGILLIALGTAGVLSLVASGGSYVMTVIRSYLRGLAGQLSPVLPFLIIWFGAALAVSCYHRVSFRAPFFALLLYLNILALMTCMTMVRSQGTMNLMDYIKTYNNQHFTARSFPAASLPAYVQQLFNWGYRMDPLAAGGALSLVFAYPAYMLFGAVGSQILEVVLTIACLFLLLQVRPTRLIRGASDMLERWRQKRVNPAAQEPAVREPAQSGMSPIEEQKPAYAPTNPYSNVRWIYDEPQEQPAQPAVNENPFMRPGAVVQDPAPSYETPAYEPAAANSPFVPVNTQNDLYHEPFVLHPDGAYDVSAEPEQPASAAAPAAEEPLPWEKPAATKKEAKREDVQPALTDDQPFMPPREEKKPRGKAPAAVQPPVQPVAAEESRDELPEDAWRAIKRETERKPVPAAPKPVQQAAPADDEPLPWEDPLPKQPAARQPAAAEIPEETDEGLSEWQKQLKKAKDSLNQTRKQLQELSGSGKAPQPVHTDPIDLPVIHHEPIKPAAQPAQPRNDARLDSTPAMPRPAAPVIQNGPYVPPPMSFLSLPKAVNPSESTQEDQYRAQQIERTLKTFNVDAQVREITHGPAITRFALKLAEGIKVKQVTSVLDNLMLEMGSDRLRLETPIPGTSYIGIEAPNNKVSPVTLREVLDSPEMQAARSPLAVALGKDIAGKPIIGDLSRMPHLLIAGATGSGKSVCINSIVCSLLYRTSPKDVRLIMVDPKQVELQVYNGIPHLLIPVVCDPKKAAVALNWTVNEMLERYGRFSKQNVRNLEGYNKKMPESDRLPHIVVIIDEMADLMEVCRKDVEESIRRLAALARAAGIFLVLATQRPSVDVITGVIKNNIPSRIAFTVSSGVDSRTIIDINGAEKLMGKGDMLYLPVGASKPLRVQGCFVTDDEVARIAENIQARYHPDYNHSIQDVLEHTADTGSDTDETVDSPSDVRESEFSDLFSEAVRMAVQDGQTSISMLQRTLRIGYARAGRIIDEMTKRGIISESEGSKPRKTIISRDEYVQMMSEGLLSGGGDT